MRTVNLIAKKREGQSHSRAELEHLILGYASGDVPDYQLAAWLMAVCWQGMTLEETTDLTEVMARSGAMLDLSGLSHTVDKHSSGGVGDKTSLILAPLLASCGARVAKMSGRGLGHTGGTIDKLEAIPGFRAVLDEEEFLEQARKIGVVITGQSKTLAPADGLLYALRDVTATVASLPLIAGSIMSKKLAGGASSIVLDVKVGSGAFMSSLEEAHALALTMVEIGRRSGRKVRAVISRMDEPLGNAIGNTLEVREALACLQGEGPDDLRELVLTLAEEALAATGLTLTREAIRQRLEGGEAKDRFVAWIGAQGGDASALDRLELAMDCYQIKAQDEGWLAELNALKIGRAVARLGGGRKKKGDEIDPGVGIIMHAKLGQRIRMGEPLLTIHHRHGRGLKEALKALEGAVRIAPEPLSPPPLIAEILR